jgi:protein involved in polysaccharide export with SLBB domain
MASSLLLASLLVVLAQAPAGVAASPMGAPGYRVGPGDVLEVNVPGRPDLSRLPTVQTTGTVFLPLLDAVGVEGLTVGEIRSRLTKLLAERDVVVSAIEVRVKEYQSHFVWVRGEVNRAGRKPLRAGTRLVDALVEAGGFSSRASGEVTVARLEGAFADGSKVRRFRFRPAAPTAEGQLDLELPLRHRDVVTASLQRYVTVAGAVARPGRYALEDRLTVSRVISTAGGPIRSGGRKVIVQRQDPQTGTTQSLEVDLKAVESGREPDVELLPDDAVSVKGRRL